MGRDMLDHPVELLPGAKEAITALSTEFRLVLITKGDLLHQEKKLAQSGLGDSFHGVEIVSEKTTETYIQSFARHGSGAKEALMAGNSMKSDVLPALEAGAWGVFVPHHLEWEHEVAEAPVGRKRFREIASLETLPELVSGIL